MPSLAYAPSSMNVSHYIPNFYDNDIISVSSLDDDSEDENPPLPTHLPPIDCIEHELAPKT